MRLVAIGLFVGCSWSCSVGATCWDHAEAIYGVPGALLYAVASAESDMRPLARNMSHLERTKSYDIGLMQINSSHLPTLRRFGISEADLYAPCTNVMVGAWILASLAAKHGLSWEAVGAYNAACTQLKGHACTTARTKYAWRVYRRLPRTSASSPQASAPEASAPPPPPTFILSARVSP
jgi:soluble lytic murein transglycosylase-like protein